MNWSFLSLMYFALMSILEISIAIPVLFLNGILRFKVSGFYILDLSTLKSIWLDYSFFSFPSLKISPSNRALSAFVFCITAYIEGFKSNILFSTLHLSYLLNALFCFLSSWFISPFLPIIFQNVCTFYVLVMTLEIIICLLNFPLFKFNCR